MYSDLSKGTEKQAPSTPVTNPILAESSTHEPYAITKLINVNSRRFGTTGPSPLAMIGAFH